MDIFLLVVLSLFIVISWIITTRYLPIYDFGEQIAVSIPLGCGFCSLWLFAAYVSAFNVMIWISLGFMFALLLKVITNKNLIMDLKSYSCIQVSRNSWKNYFSKRILLNWLILLVLFIVSLLFSVYFPTMTPDGFGYDYFGKLLAAKKDMSIYFQEFPVYRTPITHLLHSYFYLFNFNYPKIIYPFYYLSIVLFLYFKLKERVKDEDYCLMFTLILATTPVFWWRSYLVLNNLIAATYLFFAVVYWRETIDRPKENLTKYYLLSGLFFAFAIWARLEFIFSFIITLVITIVSKKDTEKKHELFYFCLFPVTVTLVWLFLYFCLTNLSIVKYQEHILTFALILFLFLLFKKIGKNGFFIVTILSLIAFFYFSGNYLSEGSFEKVREVIGFFKFRIIINIVLNGYWVFTVLLALFIPLFWRRLDNSERKIALFLLCYFITVNVIVNATGRPRDYELGIINMVISLFHEVGKHINGTSQRLFLAMFPILVYLVGSSSYRINSQWNILKKRFVLHSIIFGNLVILFQIFLWPRMEIIIENPTINFEKTLTSFQVKDIYNIYQPANKLAFVVKKNLSQDSTVYFAEEEIVGSASVKNIIFPIKGVFIKKPYNEFINLSNYENIYFASKKDTFPFEQKKSISTLFYKDEDWHIFKIEPI